jgi:hypothetical protein
MTNLVVSMAGETYDADEQRVQIGNPGLDACVRNSYVALCV